MQRIRSLVGWFGIWVFSNEMHFFIIRTSFIGTKEAQNDPKLKKG